MLVHGFAQTSRCWGTLPAALTAGRRQVDPATVEVTAELEVEAVALPGHAGSGLPALDLPATAEAVARTGGRATYLGYSFGGRTCLQLALDRPDLVEALVLVGATAGLDDPAERAARRAADEQLAQRIEAEGVDAFLDTWLSLPLFAGVPDAYQYRDERRRNDAAGLAASLRRAGTGAQEPLWSRLGELGPARLPVLLVTGALDTKFTALARRLADGIGPTAETVVIAGAGHTAHLERPAAFEATVLDWLARTPPRA